MWWAVQTLTSLGYGDFAPTTFLGKVSRANSKLRKYGKCRKCRKYMKNHLIPVYSQIKDYFYFYLAHMIFVNHTEKNPRFISDFRSLRGKN